MRRRTDPYPRYMFSTYYTPHTHYENVRVIKDKDGKICALIIGMSDKEIEHFLASHPGAYLSTANYPMY